MSAENEKPDAAVNPSETDQARKQKLYTGGNPGFDERTPSGKKPVRPRKVYAGGNPNFDERSTK